MDVEEFTKLFDDGSEVTEEALKEIKINNYEMQKR